MFFFGDSPNRQAYLPHAIVCDGCTALTRRIAELESGLSAMQKWLDTFKTEWAATQNEVQQIKHQRFAEPGSEEWSKGHVEKVNERINDLTERFHESQHEREIHDLRNKIKEQRERLDDCSNRAQTTFGDINKEIGQLHRDVAAQKDRRYSIQLTPVNE